MQGQIGTRFGSSSSSSSGSGPTLGLGFGLCSSSHIRALGSEGEPHLFVEVRLVETKGDEEERERVQGRYQGDRPVRVRVRARVTASVTTRVADIVTVRIRVAGA